jgi:hypothetical protein
MCRIQKIGPMMVIHNFDLNFEREEIDVDAQQAE